MSKLKIGEVISTISGDESYSAMIDWMRLKHRYGDSWFSSIDPELLGILKCRSKANVSAKLQKLHLMDWASRTLPTEKRDSSGSIPYKYNVGK